MSSLNNHISTFGRPLTRFLVQTRNGTRFSQHGIIAAASGSQPKHVFPLFTLTTTHRQQFTSFRIHNCSWPNASTTRTATATITVAAKFRTATNTGTALSMTAKGILFSNLSRARPLSTTTTIAKRTASSSSSTSDKPSNQKTQRHKDWSVEENKKILELMRDKTKLRDMALHFSGRSKGSIRGCMDKVRSHLKSLDATVSDLHKETMMKTMMSNLQQRKYWSKEQDELLQSLYKQHGPDWKLIKALVSEGGTDGDRKELFPRRLAKDCRIRIESCQLEFNRGPWSTEELERFWASIREVEADYQSRGESIWRGGAHGIRTFDENDKIIREGGQSQQLRIGFWARVSEKIKTRNKVQCISNYSQLRLGKSTETGGVGRERKLWTIEELQVLRDFINGKSPGWKSSDRQRVAARECLLQTRKSSSIAQKVQYIRLKAKAQSLSTMECIERMIENKRRWGYSNKLMKEREQLIAEKMDKSITKENN